MRKRQVSELEMLSAICARRPAVFVNEVVHDPECPALKTGREDDCMCSPESAIFEVTDDGREN